MVLGRCDATKPSYFSRSRGRVLGFCWGADGGAVGGAGVRRHQEVRGIHRDLNTGMRSGGNAAPQRLGCRERRGRRPRPSLGSLSSAFSRFLRPHPTGGGPDRHKRRPNDSACGFSDSAGSGRRPASPHKHAPAHAAPRAAVSASRRTQPWGQGGPCLPGPLVPRSATFGRFPSWPCYEPAVE